MATEQVLPETPQTDGVRPRSQTADDIESLQIPLVADDRQASARKKTALTSSSSSSSNTASTTSSSSSTPSSSSSSSTKAPAFPVDPSSLDRLVVLIAIAAWYLVGVGAIVTTKILLTDWKVPPLLLTFQQLLAGSTVLRFVLSLRPEGAQPLPWEKEEMSNQLLLQHHENSNGDGEAPLPMKLGAIWEHHSDFLLTGLFNGLDFLASNTAFSHAAASFVETIKSSDPITTTAVALAWNVDRLAGAESIGLFLLIVGVLLSTWGNADTSSSTTITTRAAAAAATATTQAADATPKLTESIQGTATVIIANLCFAFRAMFQKRYRILAGADETQEQLDDVNLLCRMQQTGAIALFLPALVAHAGFVVQSIYSVPTDLQLYYIGLSVVNALCYSTYNLASTYVLSKLTVLQHSSLNCLRRMCAIVATSIFFGVPITMIGALGLLTSFVGFFAFTYFRNQSQRHQKELKEKDSVV